MADKKLFVALPVYGAIDPHFFRSLVRFTQENKLPVMMTDVVGDSAIGRARNNLTRQFLESDATDMLFIDTDLIFSAEQVARIMSHDLALVGGVYPKKQQGPTQWVLNTLDEPTQPLPNGLIEVKYIGTGFMKINRSVFEAMIKAFGSEMVYVSDHDHKTTEYDFWHMGCYEFHNGYRRWLSEDWWFCQMWRDLGGKVWADQRVVLKHSGNAVYPLESQERELDKIPARTNASDTCRELAPEEMVPLVSRAMQPV